MPFSVWELLRRAHVRFDQRGKAIVALVIVSGTALCALQFAAPAAMLDKLSIALPTLIGEQKAIELKDEISRARLGTDEHAKAIAHISEAMGNEAIRMTEEERDGFFSKNAGPLMPFLKWALMYAAILLVLQGITRLISLVIAARVPGKAGVADVAFAIPRLIALWFMIAVFTGTWASALVLAAAYIWSPILLPILVPFSLLIPLLIYPRYVAAPAILIGEETSIMGAVRTSYARTKGRYGKVLSMIIGIQVTLFLSQQAANMVLGGVMSIIALRSPYAALIGFTLQFLQVVIIAYRNMFMVELSEELKNVSPFEARKTP